MAIRRLERWYVRYQNETTPQSSNGAKTHKHKPSVRNSMTFAWTLRVRYSIFVLDCIILFVDVIIIVVVMLNSIILKRHAIATRGYHVIY